MIYLLSQMTFIILLAAIAGGALGWAFHRLRYSHTIADLRRALGQNQQQVKQAHSEVSMLSQDYDELKQTSSSTIDALRNENRQIPNLHQNLEKSQLLVRQLMQKHEAQIREYASENETLKNQLKNIDDRERALNKLQSDVKRERQDINESRKSAESATDKSVSESNASNSSTQSISDSSPESSWKSKSPGTTQASTQKPTPSKPTESAKAADDSTASAAPNVSTPVTDNATSDKTGVAKTSTAKSGSDRPTTRQTIAELTSQAQAKAKKERDQNKKANPTDDSDSLDMSSDVSGEAGSLTVALAEADVVLAAIDKKREEETLTIEDDEVIDASDLRGDMEFVDEDDSAQLFDPVDQHDDLQTIFGIGPIFERSLNKLGITSYSQLAELKRHDIEKLAVALEIMPGKIERENWVGNARRQLEDVLEEL